MLWSTAEGHQLKPGHLPLRKLESALPLATLQMRVRGSTFSTQQDKMQSTWQALAAGKEKKSTCLTPVTPTPGFSRICNACVRLVRENSEHFLQRPLENHIQFLDTLVKSAQRGCLVCALPLNKIERLVGDVEIPSELQLTYALGSKHCASCHGPLVGRKYG